MPCQSLKYNISGSPNDVNTQYSKKGWQLERVVSPFFFDTAVESDLYAF